MLMTDFCAGSGHRSIRNVCSYCERQVIRHAGVVAVHFHPSLYEPVRQFSHRGAWALMWPVNGEFYIKSKIDGSREAFYRAKPTTVQIETILSEPVRRSFGVVGPKKKKKYPRKKVTNGQ